MKHIVIVFTIMMIPLLAISQAVKEINKPTIEGLDEVTPFNEGLAAVRKDNQWGFINKEGALVIDFRNDLHWNKNADNVKTDISGVRYPIFNEGRCLISKKVEEGITVYGFIDTQGNVVIEPAFLNIRPFKDGHTTGILFEKVFRGKNEFNLNIYDFKFFDVLLNTSGEIVEFYNRRYGIQMTKSRYKLPWIGVKRLADGLVAVHNKDTGWEIRKIMLDN